MLFSRFVSTYRDRTKERGSRARFILVCIAKGTESREKHQRQNICKHVSWLVPWWPNQEWKFWRWSQLLDLYHNGRNKGMSFSNYLRKHFGLYAWPNQRLRKGVKMEDLWLVRMAKLKAREEPWIPPCLGLLDVGASSPSLFPSCFLYLRMVATYRDGVCRMNYLESPFISPFVRVPSGPIYRGWLPHAAPWGQLQQLPRRGDRARGRGIVAVSRLHLPWSARVLSF
jgi:hypothetical protein